jgi:hypothetical protein
MAGVIRGPGRAFLKRIDKQGDILSLPMARTSSRNGLSRGPATPASYATPGRRHWPAAGRQHPPRRERAGGKNMAPPPRSLAPPLAPRDQGVATPEASRERQRATPTGDAATPPRSLRASPHLPRAAIPGTHILPLLCRTANKSWPSLRAQPAFSIRSFATTRPWSHRRSSCLSPAAWPSRFRLCAWLPPSCRMLRAQPSLSR